MNHREPRNTQHGEEQFARALRRMAAAGPQNAPAELNARLRNAFRDHHARRRRALLLKIGAVAACLLAATAWTWRATHPSHSLTAIQNPPAQAKQIFAPPVQEPPTQAPSAPRPAENPIRRPSSKALVARKTSPPPANPSGATRAAMGDFMALPSFDPAIPVERSQIVRVEVAGQSLNLLGIPVSNEVFDRRIVADVAVTQDGRPYAVRFVQGYK